MIRPLNFSKQDADRTADALRQIGATVTTLVDPTRPVLLAAIEQTLRSTGQSGNFYFYFAGHGWSMNGENMVGLADLDVSGNTPTGAFSVEELKTSIRRFAPAASFAFLDVCRNEVRRVR
ncbi:MAG: caspase family protein [Acidimicrobiia bacterium]|nr:caspase family protein [Acidimicrobiia bacterium]